MTNEYDKNWEQMQPILTIDANDSINPSDNEADIVWHELQNVYRTKRVLSAILSGYEDTEGGGIGIVYYKGHRIVIPVSEMALNLEEQAGYGNMRNRQIRIINNMIGCELDFVIIALDQEAHSVVASRRIAMRAKRRRFYFPNEEGQTRIREGSKIQVRVIAVGEKAIRIDAFGAECSIVARDLAWDWLGDARERYYVGERILAVVRNIELDEKTMEVKLSAEVKSLLKNDLLEKLKGCKVQGTYVGRITDIHKGVCYVRLGIEVNGIAHTNKANRPLGKGDMVNFTVTHLDETKVVAHGLITRIIQQNIRG